MPFTLPQPKVNSLDGEFEAGGRTVIFRYSKIGPPLTDGIRNRLTAEAQSRALPMILRGFPCGILDNALAADEGGAGLLGWWIVKENTPAAARKPG